ncbi:long-chain-fatty-acid--CoA ligase 1 isoform X4 [Phyllobates terribilis]|uniref:long-chain-fatty-acid--CoA ligase 1 isoform X4 n=1 Tax=Phyllobates terribilis TaxID=111132 RepID=UPI003CCB4667
MQAHEIFKSIRIPELGDVRQLVRTLPTNTLMGFGAFAALTTYWYATRPKALKPPCDLAMQSVEVKGQEHARRSTLLDTDEIITYYYDDCRTVYEVFQRGLRVSNNGPCLGHRKPNQPYQWISYQEVSDRAEYLGSALLNRGCKPSSEQFIGIFAQNRPEWIITELCCYTYSMVAVPLYDTLGAEAITYIINKAEISLVFCDNTEKAKLLLASVENKETSGLRTVVLMDPFDEDLVERGKKCGVEIVSLRDMEEEGKNHRERPKPPKPEDLAVVCFTSGTTGNPKGAMLTHKNIVSNSAAFLKVTESLLALNASDIHISYLPLAHMFERLVQDSLGGRVRLMITGAAPVSPTVLTFLRAALGCQFYEGYGQTECTAGCSLTIPGDWTAGHVGAPMPCNYVKLVDVDEMNYFAVKGEGEVCVKGSNVFQGYLKDDEKTAEALDKDGWLHTGDVGKWLPNGTLKIIDRKKHIFKLAQGEYIAPEKIENIYTRSEAVVQIFVHGESIQAFLVAIVIPDPDNVLNWAKKKKFEGTYEDLCKNKDFKNAVLEDLLRLGKEAGLKTFEQVKDIVLHPEMFSIQNNLLTPTLKAKRPELRKYFHAQIEELYANNKV